MPLTGLDAENKEEATPAETVAAATAAAPNDNENPPAAAAAPTTPTPTSLSHSNDRALLIATRNGMKEHVTHLLRRGASNVHVRDPVEQKTPLILAAEKDSTELVELLLRFHANVHDTCPQGMTVSQRQNADGTRDYLVVQSFSHLSLFCFYLGTPLRGMARK